MKNHFIKLIVTLIAVILLAIVILLYFIDNTMGWNIDKILSCIIISIWISFIPQTITYYFYKIKNSEMEYSVKLGYEIGAKGFLGLLLAPYNGIKFYFVDLNELRYNGEFFL